MLGARDLLEHLGAHAAHPGVGVGEARERRRDRGGVARHHTERIALDEEWLRASGAERVGERATVGAARAQDEHERDERHAEADERDLLRLERAVAGQQEDARERDARLSGHALHERTGLVAPFRRDGVEERLVRRVRDAGEPDQLHEAERDHGRQAGHGREDGEPHEIDPGEGDDRVHHPDARVDPVR